MSVMNHERLRRWYDEFPPRGAWRASGGLIAFGMLAQRSLIGAIAVLIAFAVAEVVFDAADRSTDR